jgi:hypothetical protein
MVRVVGRVALHGEAQLTTLLGGHPCVAFRVHVEKRVPGRKSSHWRTAFDDRQSIDFIVEDPSGRALVMARGGRFLIDLDHHHSGTVRARPPALEAYLAGRGHPSAGLRARATRYREGGLEIGETVAAVGVARWEDDPSGDAVETTDFAAPRAVSGWSSSPAPMARSTRATPSTRPVERRAPSDSLAR